MPNPRHSNHRPRVAGIRRPTVAPAPQPAAEPAEEIVDVPEAKTADKPKPSLWKKYRALVFGIAACVGIIACIAIISALAKGLSDAHYMANRQICLNSNPGNFMKCNTDALNATSGGGSSTTWMIVWIIVWVILTVVRRRPYKKPEKETTLTKFWASARKPVGRVAWWIVGAIAVWQSIAWIISLF